MFENKRKYVWYSYFTKINIKINQINKFKLNFKIQKKNHIFFKIAISLGLNIFQIDFYKYIHKNKIPKSTLKLTKKKKKVNKIKLEESSLVASSSSNWCVNCTLLHALIFCFFNCWNFTEEKQRILISHIFSPEILKI